MNTPVPNSSGTLLAACAIAAVALGAAPSRSFADPAIEKVLHVYKNNINQTNMPGEQVAPVLGSDGRLYGTTIAGGPENKGTLFRLDPVTGYTTVYDYAKTGGPQFPSNYLVAATDGNLYGVSQRGGNHDGGTVYRIDPAGNATVLASFHRYTGINSLMQASDGTFYGTTSAGGANDSGTVFRMTANGAEVIYSFDYAAGCGYPLTQMIQATDGWLYGTSSSSPLHSGGCVYRVSPAGEFQLVYMFSSPTDAYYPIGRLLQGRDGALYGTSQLGGVDGSGAVYRVTLQGEETIVHSFMSFQDGREPISSLNQDVDGNLIGLTFRGNTAWRVSPDGDNFEVLYVWGSSERDSRAPEDMMLAPDGNFYGITAGSPHYFDGSLFKLTIK